MVEETKEGLNIEIVDQEGRSMFPEGSKEPFERTRRIIQKIAGPLKEMPYRVAITLTKDGKPNVDAWLKSVEEKYRSGAEK